MRRTTREAAAGTDPWTSCGARGASLTWDTITETCELPSNGGRPPTLVWKSGAQGVNVRAVIPAAPAPLLRGDVVRRPHDDAIVGHRVAGADLLREAEVDDLG